MPIIEEVKSIAKTIQQIGSIELYQQILDLQAKIMDLLQENQSLKENISALEEKMSIAEKLTFRNDAYWLPNSRGADDGPFCTNCWDTKSKLVRMHSTADPKCKRCPSCSNVVKVGRVGNR